MKERKAKRKKWERMKENDRKREKKFCENSWAQKMKIKSKNEDVFYFIPTLDVVQMTTTTTTALQEHFFKYFFKFQDKKLM